MVATTAPVQDAVEVVAAATAAAAGYGPLEEVITGVLWKRGAAGTGGANSWKMRFVVLASGVLSYYTTQAAYEKAAAPIKGNRIPLKAYAVVKGLYGTPAASSAGSSAPPAAEAAFYLEPLPDGASTVMAPAAAADTAAAAEVAAAAAAESAAAGDVGSRVWQFRSVETYDRNNWVDGERP